MKYYPKGNENVLQYFKNEFESCFILFHPFLMMNNENNETELQRTSSIRQDSVPEDIKKLLNGNSLSSSTSIYSSNENYPNEIDIISKGTSVSWSTILNKSNALETFSDIQKGLKTSIGAYRKIFQREDLQKPIEQILTTSKLWSPKEDEINTLTKMSIYKIFKALELEKIVDLNLNQNVNSIDISEMTIKEFCRAFNSTVIYSENKEIMISQDRDTFYCLLLTKKGITMQRVLNKFKLEGIQCDASTCLPWELSNKEYIEFLQREKQQKSNKENSKS